MVAIRVGTPGACIVPGASQRPCDRCGKPVWVSRTSFDVIEKEQRVLSCLECLTAEEQEDAFRRPVIRPEQLGELRKYLEEQN